MYQSQTLDLVASIIAWGLGTTDINHDTLQSKICPLKKSFKGCSFLYGPYISAVAYLTSLIFKIWACLVTHCLPNLPRIYVHRHVLSLFLLLGRSLSVKKKSNLFLLIYSTLHQALSFFSEIFWLLFYWIQYASSWEFLWFIIHYIK